METEARRLKILVTAGLIGVPLFFACNVLGVSDDSLTLTADAEGGCCYSGDGEIATTPTAGLEPLNEGDSYEDVGTNPFVYSAYDPFSTFAADVDTASYDIFKRDIENGYLPVKESVRLEEYVNYFSYSYPMPKESDEHPLSITVDSAPGIFRDGTRLLRVGLQARHLPTDEKRPANLVFLVDTSGSMSSANKLGLVRKLLQQATAILEPDDRISIVTYAGSTRVVLPSTPVSQQQDILNAVARLSSGGGTAGAAGIDLAYQQAESVFIEDGINHVMLCTDGDFNVGVSDTESLVELIVQKRETGITLTVLGFGTGNLNDFMMGSISNAGNGTYAVISSESDAADYVENQMLSSLYFVAKDLKIQVEFNPAHVKAYRLLGYENRALADDDFRIDNVDAGEVGSGQRVTALYEMVMAGGAVPQGQGAPDPLNGDPVDGEREVNSSDLVLVKIRYKQPDAGSADPAFEVTRSLKPVHVEDTLGEAGTDLQWAAAVAAFAEILKESPYSDRAHIGRISDIVLEKNWTDSRRAEFASLFTQAQTKLGTE